MTSVHNVAAGILERTGNLSTMKLQKLCYYAQGWHLAWHGVPLFEEPLEAWKMGPVCRDLYRYHKGEASVVEWPKGAASELSPVERRTIDAIVDFYAPYSGFDLGRKTHGERPWIEAYEGATPFMRGHVPIKQETMKQYFQELNANATTG